MPAEFDDWRPALIGGAMLLALLVAGYLVNRAPQTKPAPSTPIPTAIAAPSSPSPPLNFAATPNPMGAPTSEDVAAQDSVAAAVALLRRYSHVEILRWTCDNQGGIVTTEGRIENITDKPIPSVVVIAAYYTKGARELGTAEQALGHGLAPGQSASFRVMGNGGPDAKRCSVRARTADGTPLDVYKEQ